MTTAIDLLATLREGLPGTASEPRHVVIVGAGIAGLTAGMLLKEAGHTVTILEARNRLGGRIYTYRGFAGRMYGEFGAMRFPRQHHLGQHLIHERFGLATTPFGMEDEDTFIHLQGRGVRRSEFTADTFDFPLAGARARRRRRRRSCKRAMQPLIELIAEPGGWSGSSSSTTGYSLLGWLIERGVSERRSCAPRARCSTSRAASTSRWWSGSPTGTTTSSATSSTSTPGRRHAPRRVRPAAARRHPARRRGHAIDQDADGVTVHYRDAVGTRDVGRRRRVHRDRAVRPAAAHGDRPGSTSTKGFTLRNVYYGRAHKIFMQFSRRWWVEDEQITHGVTVTDLAIRNVVYTPAGQDPSGAARACSSRSYAWEQDTMAYSMLSEHERITQALEDLAKIHPARRATRSSSGSRTTGRSTGTAGGIGPLFRPFEMTSEAYDDVVRPVGRLWFANDACDRVGRRWIEGAIAAAVKNA